jgi:NAD(P)-dependent dehydrogenase (short-subunit alcohol dehydrogenase family)
LAIVTDDQSVDAAAASVRAKYGRVDVIINNAGIGIQTRRSGDGGGGVREAMRQCLATNVVGAVSVTEAFLPLLLTPKPTTPANSRKRVVFISSTTGSLSYASDPNHVLHGSGGAIDYRTSKAALSMVIIEYDAMLKGKGVAVHGVNPGCTCCSTLLSLILPSFWCLRISASLSWDEGMSLGSTLVLRE